MHRIAVVGGGLSGLAHAYYIKKKWPDSEITVFEPGKLGGNIRTEEFEGYLLETGPDSYLDRSGLLNALVRELSIQTELLFEEKRSAQRYILKDGFLAKAPKSAGGLITSSLLFFPEKIKIFFAMRKKFSLWPTITLFDTARNILGLSAAEYLASPFARGVFGSEAEDLEFSALFPELFKKITTAPKLKNALKEFSIERREFWAGELGNISFERGIYSFKKGLATLVDALAEALKKQGVNIVADKISKIQIDQEKRHNLSSKAKAFGAFDRVVFSVGATELAYIWRDLDKDLSRKVAELSSSAVSVVYNGWNKKEFAPGGYGFLAPRKERAAILGCIFASNVFPGRAPGGKFLTKTMISGDSGVFKDEELADMAEGSLARLLKIRSKPLWRKVYRHNPGIPRYAPGYSEWKRDVFDLLKKHEGVHLAGWCFSGVGLADQLESAYLYARNLG
jgi:protoporphyrinogen/coproporphyrinogen III oxidase